MFVVDKVVDEDRRLSDASSLSSSSPPAQDLELVDTTLPDGTVKALGPSARDAFAIFEDLCLLANSERPKLLKLEFLHKTFALELIESVLTNYHDLFRRVRPAPCAINIRRLTRFIYLLVGVGSILSSCSCCNIIFVHSCLNHSPSVRFSRLRFGPHASCSSCSSNSRLN